MNMSTSNFLLFLSQASSYSFGVYLSRFIMVMWFLIFPCIFMFSFFFFAELHKHKKFFVVYKPFQNFRYYNYFFHNVLFIFLSFAMTFNICFFIYAAIDIFILKWDNLFSWFWIGETRRGEGKAEQTPTFFWSIVFLGFCLHSVYFMFYIYYNLYKTNSYFGEAWRRFIVRNRTHKRLLAFQRKHPILYEKIEYWFLTWDTIEHPKNIKAIIIN